MRKREGLYALLMLLALLLWLGLSQGGEGFDAAGFPVP